MHALLFAGGVGQRLWPISRKNTPKQFSPIIGSKSSVQLAVERLLPIIPAINIFISTNESYADIVSTQFPSVPRANFILEPMRRDVGAAAALSFFKLYKSGIKGPIMFQWADNYVRKQEQLQDAINVGREIIKNHSDTIVFFGQIPRFPSENLGYIEHGEEIGQVGEMPYYAFRSWVYRPSPETCVRMFNAGNYLWNSGYFVTTVEFVVSQYRLLAPELTTIAEEILSYEGTSQAEAKLRELYPTMPSIHFDESFLMRLKPHHAVVLKLDLEWTDPGSLYGLKEALQTSKDANVTQGAVVAVKTSDSLIRNEEAGKVVSVMGMTGVIVVNTSDALLVIHKDSIRHIGALLEELGKQGYPGIL